MGETDDEPEQPEHNLAGGVANAGSVVRVGDHVLRPANRHTPAIHAFLRALRDAGFTGASVPVGVDDDGRERLVFVDGAVPVPPYPEWAQSDTALASTARLMADFHRGSEAFDPAAFDPSAHRWSNELADPRGGRIVCHNDVCLENVVFRDGVAVGLLDFDFAAPGRPLYDLAVMARMCVPIDDDTSAARLGWHRPDRPARLRLVADSYGLDAPGRRQLLDEVAAEMARAGTFVRRRVEAGDPNFVAMWNRMGGMDRFDRQRRWWIDHHPHFAAALDL